jgi:DNA-binding response OmpR family regulator
MSSRVLFAEDNADIRELVREQLEENGYLVQTAGDGEEAMQMLGAATYDLALLDIRMPRRDGLAVLRHIRAQNLPCRVIMLTGVDELSVAIGAVKLGADDYITKPYSLEALLACIDRVLGI